MKLCPNCQKQIESFCDGCKSCEWKIEYRENIPVLLSNRNSMDNLFKVYIDNYEQISHDDLEESIQPERYLKSQTDKLYSYLPSTQGKDVCEVGVGKGGLFHKLIQSKPKSIWGIDISAPYLKILSSTYAAFDNVNFCIANAEIEP